MHLPYARMIGCEGCTIVPIIVGEINDQNSENYARILKPYFDKEKTVFLVSSDFCHWGDRFDYQWYKKEDGPIFESIAKLDKLGMKLIEEQNYK